MSRPGFTHEVSMTWFVLSSRLISVSLSLFLSVSADLSISRRCLYTPYIHRRLRDGWWCRRLRNRRLRLTWFTRAKRRRRRRRHRCRFLENEAVRRLSLDGSIRWFPTTDAFLARWSAGNSNGTNGVFVIDLTYLKFESGFANYLRLKGSFVGVSLGVSLERSRRLASSFIKMISVLYRKRALARDFREISERGLYKLWIEYALMFFRLILNCICVWKRNSLSSRVLLN